MRGFTRVYVMTDLFGTDTMSDMLARLDVHVRIVLKSSRRRMKWPEPRLQADASCGQFSVPSISPQVSGFRRWTNVWVQCMRSPSCDAE